jgi:hypothetical protein
VFPGQKKQIPCKIFQGLPLLCVYLLPLAAMHLLCHLACIMFVHCMLYMGSERMAYSLASGDSFCGFTCLLRVLCRVLRV